MTGNWLTVSATITRIWTETGYLFTGDDVLRLGKRTGAWGLVVETSHDHARVLEQSVDAHVEWLNAPKSARPTVGGGPKLPDDIEDEYRIRKDEP